MTDYPLKLPSKKKVTEIHWFPLLKCEHSLVFSFVYDSKQNMFGLGLLVGQNTHCEDVTLKIVVGIFSYFLTFYRP